MKKVILVAAAAFAFVATSFAQNAATPAPAPMPKMAKKSKGKSADAAAPAQQAGEKAPDMGDSKEHGKGHGEGKGKGGVNNALGLSPEQETQFKAANEAHKSAVKVVQSNESLAVDAKKAQVKELIAKYESDVKAIMNADQFAKWTAMRAKRNEKKGDHKEGDDHKKGGHKAEGSATPKPMPAEGTATPAAPVMKVKKSNKSN